MNKEITQYPDLVRKMQGELRVARNSPNKCCKDTAIERKYLELARARNARTTRPIK